MSRQRHEYTCPHCGRFVAKLGKEFTEHLQKKHGLSLKKAKALQSGLSVLVQAVSFAKIRSR
jgi:hypothetical protein